MSFTLQKHSCINIYLMWKSWGYKWRHPYWWNKNCLNFHEFTSSLVFGAYPHYNWHVAVLVVNFMNYARKTTYHVSHYNHIVLCNFQSAILEKGNSSDSSILITTQPRFSIGINLAPCFGPLPKTKYYPLSNIRKLFLMIKVPAFYYHEVLMIVTLKCVIATLCFHLNKLWLESRVVGGVTDMLHFPSGVHILSGIFWHILLVSRCLLSFSSVFFSSVFSKKIGVWVTVNQWFSNLCGVGCELFPWLLQWPVPEKCLRTTAVDLFTTITTPLGGKTKTFSFMLTCQGDDSHPMNMPHKYMHVITLQPSVVKMLLYELWFNNVLWEWTKNQILSKTYLWQSRLGM